MLRTHTAKGQRDVSGGYAMYSSKRDNVGSVDRNVAKEHGICRACPRGRVQSYAKTKPPKRFIDRIKGSWIRSGKYSNVMVNEYLICRVSVRNEVWEDLFISLQYTTCWNIPGCGVELKWPAKMIAWLFKTSFSLALSRPETTRLAKEVEFNCEDINTFLGTCLKFLINSNLTVCVTQEYILCKLQIKSLLRK
jgi:hypothetical protein